MSSDETCNLERRSGSSHRIHNGRGFLFRQGVPGSGRPGFRLTTPEDPKQRTRVTIGSCACLDGGLNRQFHDDFSNCILVSRSGDLEAKSLQILQDSFRHGGPLERALGLVVGGDEPLHYADQVYDA